MADIKCVVVGDGDVGKTELLISYTTNTFSKEYIPTVFDNYTTDVIVDGKLVHLGLWDTTGQADYDRLRPLSYRDTDVFVMCYSVVSPSSFENIREKWFMEVQHYSPGTPMILVGTYSEKEHDAAVLAQLAARGTKPVSSEEAEDMAYQLCATTFMRASAITQEGVAEVFDAAIRAVLNGQNAGRYRVLSTGKNALSEEELRLRAVARQTKPVFAAPSADGSAVSMAFGTGKDARWRKVVMRGIRFSQENQLESVGRGAADMRSLRSVRFEGVSVDAGNVGAAGEALAAGLLARPVSLEIEQSPTLAALLLDRGRLLPQWVLIKSRLRSLSMVACGVGAAHVRALADALASKPRHALQVASLTLEGPHLFGVDEAVALLAAFAAAADKLTGLRLLRLRFDMALPPEAARHAAKLVSACKSLRSLDLVACGFGDSEAEALFAAAADRKKALERLCLDGNAAITLESPAAAAGLNAMASHKRAPGEVSLESCGIAELSVAAYAGAHEWRTRALALLGNEVVNLPDGIVRKGGAAVVRHIRATCKGVEPLECTKVMMIGHGAAGKTTLARRALLKLRLLSADVARWSTAEVVLWLESRDVQKTLLDGVRRAGLDGSSFWPPVAPPGAASDWPFCLTERLMAGWDGLERAEVERLREELATLLPQVRNRVTLECARLMPEAEAAEWPEAACAAAERIVRGVPSAEDAALGVRLGELFFHNSTVSLQTAGELSVPLKGKWRGRFVRAELIDYAGQVEYYVTHQLFLASPVAQYVLVASLATDYWRTETHFWFSFLRALFSPRVREVPVCVVLTHADALPPGTHPPDTDTLRDELQRMYGPQLSVRFVVAVSAVGTSARDLEALDRIREHVLEMARRTAVQRPVPGSYAAAWRCVTEMTSARRTLEGVYGADGREVRSVPVVDVRSLVDALRAAYSTARKGAEDVPDEQQLSDTVAYLQSQALLLRDPRSLNVVLSPLSWLSRLLGALVGENRVSPLIARRAGVVQDVDLRENAAHLDCGRSELDLVMQVLAALEICLPLYGSGINCSAVAPEADDAARRRRASTMARSGGHWIGAKQVCWERYAELAERLIRRSQSRDAKPGDRAFAADAREQLAAARARRDLDLLDANDLLPLVPQARQAELMRNGARGPLPTAYLVPALLPPPLDTVDLRSELQIERIQAARMSDRFEPPRARSLFQISIFARPTLYVLGRRWTVPYSTAGRSDRIPPPFFSALLHRLYRSFGMHDLRMRHGLAVIDAVESPECSAAVVHWSPGSQAITVAVAGLGEHPAALCQQLYNVVEDVLLLYRGLTALERHALCTHCLRSGGHPGAVDSFRLVAADGYAAGAFEEWRDARREMLEVEVGGRRRTALLSTAKTYLPDGAALPPRLLDESKGEDLDAQRRALGTASAWGMWTLPERPADPDVDAFVCRHTRAALRTTDMVRGLEIPEPTAANASDDAGSFTDDAKAWVEPLDPGRAPGCLEMERDHDLFLSHSGGDKRMALLVYTYLSALGYKVWFDVGSIVDRVDVDIVRGIARSHVLLALLSKSFFDTRRSAWPQMELLTALTMGGPAAAYPVFCMPVEEVRDSGGLARGFEGRDGRPRTVGREIKALRGVRDVHDFSDMTAKKLKEIAYDVQRKVEQRGGAGVDLPDILDAAAWSGFFDAACAAHVRRFPDEESARSGSRVELDAAVREAHTALDPALLRTESGRAVRRVAVVLEEHRDERLGHMLAGEVVDVVGEMAQLATGQAVRVRRAIGAEGDMPASKLDTSCTYPFPTLYAAFAFEPAEECGTVRFAPGDAFVLLSERRAADDGYVLARKADGGEIGYVPSTYFVSHL